MSLFSKLNLDPGETIILEVRRHWIVFISRIVFFLVLFVAPPIIYTLTVAFAPATVTIYAYAYFSMLLFLYSLWLLLLWTGLFIQWTNYYLDVWYITEKRIIDVNQKRIFHREVSNLRFDKIQDISIEVKGIVATFLNFGDLKVQTAAEDSSDFFMVSAARPEEVRKVIFSHHNKEAEKMHKQGADVINVSDGYKGGNNHEGKI
jgi:energy-coupling factor transporter transmembrane protein EcfT